MIRLEKALKTCVIAISQVSSHLKNSTDTAESSSLVNACAKVAFVMSNPVFSSHGHGCTMPKVQNGKKEPFICLD